MFGPDFFANLVELPHITECPDGAFIVKYRHQYSIAKDAEELKELVAHLTGFNLTGSVLGPAPSKKAYAYHNAEEAKVTWPVPDEIKEK